VPRWLRILFAMVVLSVWTAFAIGQLIKGELPDLKFLGLPGGLVLILWPPRRKSSSEDNEE
jgi:hypothetical protein